MGVVMVDDNARWHGRSVASKLLAILDAYSVAEPTLSLNELAQRTGLPLSTTYRLASELVEWGGLERAEEGGYRVGLRLWEVGSLAPRGSMLRDVALPYMTDLYEVTRENVHLAVRQGREALYVEKVSGRDAIRVRSRLGGRLPLHATGVGKVLLAHAPPELLDDLLAAGLKRYTAHTVVAPGLVRRSLAEVRRTGFAVTRDELTVGAFTVAAPLFGADGTVVAAIDLVVRSARADVRRLGPAVRCAAAGVSRELRNRAFVAGPLPLASSTA
jgi:DNA-binding IclR family transcriptional regulator